MSEQATTGRRLAGALFAMVTALAGPAMAQVPEGLGGDMMGGALTAEEIEQLRGMADIPAGEGAGNVDELIARLGLAPIAEEGDAGIDHVTRGAALIGYVPQGAQIERPLRQPGEPLEGEGRELIRGEATALSGDSFTIDGRKLRLQGVRAPGGDDQCMTVDGSHFDCAEWASEAAAGLVDGKELSCAITAEEDEAGIAIGWCEIALSEDDIRDLGHLAVRAGLLLSSDMVGGVSFYRAEQADAERQRAGLWSAHFIPGCHASGVCTQ